MYKFSHLTVIETFSENIFENVYKSQDNHNIDDYFYVIDLLFNDIPLPAFYFIKTETKNFECLNNSKIIKGLSILYRLYNNTQISIINDYQTISKFQIDGVIINPLDIILDKNLFHLIKSGQYNETQTELFRQINYNIWHNKMSYYIINHKNKQCLIFLNTVLLL